MILLINTKSCAHTKEDHTIKRQSNEKLRKRHLVGTHTIIVVMIEL